MKPALSRMKGFTLIELVIVVILLGIMSAVLAPLAVSSLRAYDDVLSNVIVLDKLRYATERLAREIREVNYDGTNFAFATPVPATCVNTNNSMQFTRTSYNDVGVAAGDTTVTVCTANNTVTLNYATETLPCSVANGKILTDEVGSLRFCYRQSDGATLATTASDVRYIDIDLTLQHTIDGVTQPYTQTTRVELKRYQKQ